MAFEDELVERLQDRFPDDLRAASVDGPGRVRAEVDRDGLRQFCHHLRDEEGFEHLSCISAVDHVTRLENVYHIVSYANDTTLQLHVNVPTDDPEVETISDIWMGALYHEREAWDLMGIRFRHHPDLRRILLPDDFEFHPLRKDYEGL